jgi:hypothetical protein
MRAFVAAADNPMRRISLFGCSLALLCLAFASSAAAQAPKRFAGFFGYSSEADITFAPAISIPISVPTVSLNGWDGSFEARMLPFLGVVGDVSGHYGSFGATVGCKVIVVCAPVAGNVDSSLYTYMIGPQVSVRLWRFTPFVRVLVGAAHIAHHAAATELNTLTTSDTSFADGIGGGLDIRLVSIFGLRLQADLIQTRFFASLSPINFFTSTQSNFRGSTGIVVRF